MFLDANVPASGKIGTRAITGISAMRRMYSFRSYGLKNSASTSTRVPVPV
jgi:hypothetical protein